MDVIDNRRQIVKEELERMRNLNLITEEEYKKVNTAHERYIKRLKEKPIVTAIHPALKQKVPEQQVSSIHPAPDKGKIAELQNPFPKTKNLPPRKVKTPQDIRERNITLVLILGVIFILLSGLILATSNWDMLSNTLKTALIALVSILFFGISVFSEKRLKIHKTALAFWILGGLFFPVAILSAGYFQLFGSWLSIFGEGKYLLGAIGATLCIPVYAYSTIKYKSRIFSWLSLAALSIAISFLLAALHISRDEHYLTIAVYNAILLLAYNKIKSNKTIQFFMKEIPLFTQINLAIIAVLMIRSFNKPSILICFAYIVIAANYMYLAYLTKKKFLGYLVPLFVFCSANELYSLIGKTHLPYPYTMHLLIISIFIFIVMYYFNRWKYTELARGGSGIISLILMPAASLMAVFKNTWGIASMAMLIYGVMLYMVSVRIKKAPFKILIRVIIPFTLYMGLLEIYGKINQYTAAYQIPWYDIKLHFGAVALTLFALSVLARWIKKDLEKYLLYFSHLILPLTILLLYGEYKDNPLLFIISGFIYLYSLSISKYEWERRFNLYAALLMGTFTLYSLGLLLKVKDIYHVYVMFISSVLIGALWLVLKGAWKRRILHYLIVFSLAGMILIITRYLALQNSL